MLRIIGYFKLAGVALVTLCLLIQLGIFLFNGDELAIKLFVFSLLILIGFPYVYYLVKTGLNNVKGKSTSVNILMLVGLLMHFILCVGLIIYSLQLFPSDEVSKNLFVTTLPFFCAGIYIGVNDAVLFYKSWKTLHTQNN